MRPAAHKPQARDVRGMTGVTILYDRRSLFSIDHYDSPVTQ
jgi:hypothetical protein